MKRLVVCCDGTWGSASNPLVTNVVKIAEAVRLDAAVEAGGSIGQRVFYTDGPGSRGYFMDKYLGGAFGLGLDAGLSTMYWQLVLNWEPDDEIFVFGFSRGAYIARSLTGLIHRIGLLTAEAMIDGKFPEAMRIFRQRKANPDDPDPAEWAEFRTRYCQSPVPIKFIGVFDTVGAMGVPGITSDRYRFHDLRLSPSVHTARQALAVDERRRVYEPCLWEVTDEVGVAQQRPDRVKQVWFEGCHTDVGGGMPDSRLSDRSLRWMVREAREQGLEFDDELLGKILERGESATGPVRPSNNLTLFYRITNLVGGLFNPRNPRFYRDAWRRLAAPEDKRVYLASCAKPHADYDPANVQRWSRECDDRIPVEQTGNATATPAPAATEPVRA
ncbi:DUF2235 domain-containing protein [Nocardia macrotermitis]|uniref:T6SS Phospholipase effector Tle1-like catalytic domain-containing protein n=1 Tax=Nocardia macrotermitis TaxID=2585198 RepID=A0A7K0D689_9NOCA|nr:DUF2235 domain-containing protein [Nocardia macrotermitis]MQY21239.1 hypothetical protein [Nocardia macrotermitis]